MDDLKINTIPHVLLARILIQLHTFPPKEYPDLVGLLSDGLEKYGNSSNLNAFLDYCASFVVTEQDDWTWKNYDINKEGDWDSSHLKIPLSLVGQRFLLSLETARKQVELTKCGTMALSNPKCNYNYKNHVFPIDQVLLDTVAYFKQQGKMNDTLQKLIDLRLDKYTRDKEQFQQESNQFDDSTYQLMGALMARYDITSTQGLASKSWCLYLRDYMKSEDGSVWRVFYDSIEETVDADQALADIRGTQVNTTQPSESSKGYRPLYLFYVNQDRLVIDKAEQHITLDDYTFDEEEEEQCYEQQPIEEDEFCKTCGQQEIINDVNDMFFCEYCNRGVHQLCEVPPIQEFEKQVDPWYCRACCKLNGLPLPTLLPIKRKRSDDGFDCHINKEDSSLMYLLSSYFPDGFVHQLN